MDWDNRRNYSYIIQWKRSQQPPVYIPSRHRGFQRFQWSHLGKFDRVMREIESTMDPYDASESDSGSDHDFDHDNSQSDSESSSEVKSQSQEQKSERPKDTGERE